MTPCDSFNRVLTSAFTAESPACSENIRASWNAIANITKDGMSYIYLSDLRFVSNDVWGSHINYVMYIARGGGKAKCYGALYIWEVKDSVT